MSQQVHIAHQGFLSQRHSLIEPILRGGSRSAEPDRPVVRRFRQVKAGFQLTAAT